MLSLFFFISCFSSATWFVYALLFIKDKLGDNDLSMIDAQTAALYVGLIVFPCWMIWQVFGIIDQYARQKSVDLKLLQLFNQMKKNQDYTDLVVRVMLDAEHEIKDGFVIGKFDTFLSDINGILADIAQRANVASSLQIEQLWKRLKNGEQWVIAKTIIDAAGSHDDFTAYLSQKASRDTVFKGTLLEFCDRYQNLSAMLEKHDRDRVFINILETGAMGKVYAILAPAAEAVDVEPEKEQISVESSFSERLMKIEAPQDTPKESTIWQKLNPFSKKEIPSTRNTSEEENSDKDFFAALEKSMETSETQNRLNIRQNTDFEDSEPRFDRSLYEQENPENNEPTLGAIGAEETLSPKPYLEKSMEENKNEALTIKAPKILQEEPESEQSPTDDEESGQSPTDDETDFIYPFGRWADEKNYKK